LSIFDICFGTFNHQPGVAPENLGLNERDGYPGQHNPGRAMLFPLSTQPVSREPDLSQNSRGR
jgi:hypothetical protein